MRIERDQLVAIVEQYCSSGVVVQLAREHGFVNVVLAFEAVLIKAAFRESGQTTLTELSESMGILRTTLKEKMNRMGLNEFFEPIRSDQSKNKRRGSTQKRMRRTS